VRRELPFARARFRTKSRRSNIAPPSTETSSLNINPIIVVNISEAFHIANSTVDLRDRIQREASPGIRFSLWIAPQLGVEGFYARGCDCAHCVTQELFSDAIVSSQHCPQTGLEEINDDRLEPDFWGVAEISLFGPWNGRQIFSAFFLRARGGCQH
jgi:hypothetical protein